MLIATELLFMLAECESTAEVPDLIYLPEDQYDELVREIGVFGVHRETYIATPYRADLYFYGIPVRRAPHSHVPTVSTWSA